MNNKFYPQMKPNCAEHSSTVYLTFILWNTTFW